MLTSGSIRDIWMMKIVLDLAGLSLRTPEIVPNVFYKFFFVSWALSPYRIGLDILVEQFIRVEFRTVSWQEKEADLLLVARDPTICSGRHMHRMLIHNQKGFPLCMAG